MSSPNSDRFAEKESDSAEKSYLQVNLMTFLDLCQKIHIDNINYTSTTVIVNNKQPNKQIKSIEDEFEPLMHRTMDFGKPHL